VAIPLQDVEPRGQARPGPAPGTEREGEPPGVEHPDDGQIDEAAQQQRGDRAALLSVSDQCDQRRLARGTRAAFRAKVRKA